jgi:alpha-L-fucosidase
MFTAALAASVSICASAAPKKVVGTPDASVLPSEAHLRYHAREIMAIVHWGLNTFTGQEWGYGNTKPSVMRPASLDPAQWVSVMKAAEIKSVVLVAKHHDGFCLWPSKDNRTYSMAVVPAPNTGRDLVRETSDACRREGLAFGVYLSPWDRHQASYGREAYVDYFFAQWRDLLDNYGEIVEIWLDGANGGTGWYGGANGGRGERRSIPRDYYQKPRLMAMLFEKHPYAVAFGGSGDRSTAWCGNERGFSPETWWNPRKGGDGKSYWLPSEADFPLRRGWFWHPNQRPKSLATLVKAYFETVGRGAVMNIGVAPDRTGRVCQADADRLAAFGAWVRAFNGVDHAEGASLTASRDGNRLVVERRLTRPTAFNCLDLRERIAGGQRVASFSAEVRCDGVWKPLAQGTTVGARRLARFPAVTGDCVRVTLEGIAPPDLFPFALRTAPEVPADSDAPARDTCAKKKWRLVDETCKLTGIGARAIDGNYRTLWHTHPIKPGPVPPPQSITVDCGETLLMRGFDYVPRQDGVRRGMVDAYAFDVSSDGKTWTRAADGEFGNLAANPVKQRVLFAAPVRARYFRFTGLHALGNNDHVAVAEIDLVAAPVPAGTAR